jgi:PIN domain nuclease of toxin-antitoxin system
VGRRAGISQVKLLLDTHTFLWAFDKPEALSRPVRDLLVDPTVERWISVIALAEIAVKVQKGKLDAPLTREFYLGQAAALSASLLAVESEHCFMLFSLPRHHGDPFDRLLIAQAKVEGLTIATIDPAFAAYGVPTVW